MCVNAPVLTDLGRAPTPRMGYPLCVPGISPTVEGFRAAFRRPALSFAEILWRWSVGASAAALIIFGVIEYLNTLPVTAGEILFLQTKQPILIAQAIARIFRGSRERGVAAALLAALAIVLLWIIAASLGRMATVSSLLDYFRPRAASVSTGAIAIDETHPQNNISRHVFRSLFRLNFLRVAVAVAAISGLAGAGILAGFVSSEADPVLAVLVFLSFAALACTAWWALNWFLSLAALFAVRDGEDALGAISAVVSLCRERAGAVFAVSFWTGLIHLVVFIAGSTVVLLPVGLAAALPWRITSLALLVITLAYFAVVDWVYMARLAGYACVAEWPEARPVPAPPALARIPPAGSATRIAQFEGAIDRDELILSDLPNPAPEP